jgi:hypothetical protein
MYGTAVRSDPTNFVAAIVESHEPESLVVGRHRQAKRAVLEQRPTTTRSTTFHAALRRVVNVVEIPPIGRTRRPTIGWTGGELPNDAPVPI